jgi:hypothetical protein
MRVAAIVRAVGVFVRVRCGFEKTGDAPGSTRWRLLADECQRRMKSLYPKKMLLKADQRCTRVVEAVFRYSVSLIEISLQKGPEQSLARWL